jgi:L-ascorbate metabolism protein UlaG (beta-lactamase superfamily)
MKLRLRKRFGNLDQVQNKKTLMDMAKWVRNRPRRRAKRKQIDLHLPQVYRVDTAFLRGNRTKTTINWIGHSTFLIQLAGLNIVTDPVWAHHMGIQKRLTPPGIPLEDLPLIDYVLISHGHYDHLHFPSLERLPGDPVFLIPEGLLSLFHKKGFTRVEEASWWQQKSAGEVDFVFVPAQHWTKRTFLDRNTSHWGGWIMRKNGSSRESQETLYFAGDSGYFRGFKEIGDRFDIDYALLPIGAYEPEWYNHLDHISPEEAVQAYVDTRAKKFVPMHYATFRLADDTPKEAIDRLAAEWERLGLPDGNLKLLKLGETLLIESQPIADEKQLSKG